MDFPFEFKAFSKEINEELRKNTSLKLEMGQYIVSI